MPNFIETTSVRLRDTVKSRDDRTELVGIMPEKWRLELSFLVADRTHQEVYRCAVSRRIQISQYNKCCIRLLFSVRAKPGTSP